LLPKAVLISNPKLYN